MGSTYGEAVLDFDLNFLHPPSNNTVAQSKLDKQRKAILIVKKKVIATDSLIKKYYTRKDDLELTEKTLLASKEECKQICLDYRKSLDTCSVLENDMHILQNTNKELAEKYFQVENQLGASKSHTHQLQILVKEYETLIESLKVENKLAKSNAKDCEKKLLLVQKESEILIKDITLAKDIIFRKIKLRSNHKVILQKYDKYKTENNDDAIFGTEDSSEDEFEDAPLSPFHHVGENMTKQTNCDQVLKSPDTTTGIKPNTVDMSKIRNNTNVNQDIEYSNDLGSVDTGRGSSLALSDSDKYSHSTDYFINDSPLSDVSIPIIHKQKLVDTATSPVPVYNSVHIGTSPIQFHENRLRYIDVGQNTDICELNSPVEVISKESEGVVIAGHAVSSNAQYETIEKGVSPISHLQTDVATSPIQFNKEIRNIFRQCEATQQLKKCLELNSSSSLCDENDGEIEVILSRMRMDHVLVTPIPMTPVKSQHADKMEVSITNKNTEHSSGFVCPDAVVAIEENKKLQASISELAKEIHNIKDILKIQFLPVHQNGQDSFLLREKDTLNYDSFTEQNDLNVLDPNAIKTSILSHSIDYEPHTINIEDVPVTNDANEIEIIEEVLITNDANVLEVIDSPFQIPPNCLHSVSSPDIGSDNEETEFIGDNNIAEPAGNSLKNIDCLQNKDDIIMSNNFKMKSPIVRCEKLDVTKAYKNIINTEKEDQSQSTPRKMAKVRKLTRLGKIKRGILPKYKIKADYSRPLKRSRMRQIVLPKKKKVVTDQDSSATLNDKSIYQKAIKIMTALKSKQKPETSLNTPAICENNKNENVDVNNKENIVRKVKKRKSVDQSINQNNDNEVFYCESSSSLNNSITTRSRSKYNIQKIITTVTNKDFEQDNIFLSELCKKNDETSSNKSALQEPRKRPRRSSEDSYSVPSKRLLRSSVSHNQTNEFDGKIANKDTHSNIEVNNTELSSLNSGKNASIAIEVYKDILEKTSKVTRNSSATEIISNNNVVISNKQENHTYNSIEEAVATNPKQSLLCVMIEKYGVQSVKYCVTKISESLIDSIAKKIEDDIANIIKLPNNETKDAMNKLVAVIENWNIKQFLSGLMKYLQEPGRKLELFKTLESPPAPPMTKSEQVLLYIVTQLKNCWPAINIVDKILSSIEYTLFALNRTPHFEIIESMSHFYAVVCRYFKLKSRLRLFMLDAMYCIQYKSITLIKQCLDVWMHILPLAHMGIAKNPLVTCLVYLLHFYKCEDKFNRVRDMRFMLSRNYFYKFTDWNEAHILDMFRNSIKEIKGNPVERKMLRISLIILAKRQGTKWCQNNIIKKILQPIIENDKTPDRVKEFCVSLLGPLMKPFPIDMKVHCEVVMNQLINMLQHNPSPNMTEAIMTSLIYMNKHNQYRVVQAMISWSPREVSYEFEEIVRGFVKSKPIKAWKTTLAKIAL